eukprot:Nitzschia sp. Nitz4//scaffold111_size72815//10531//13029//NITZ4_005780-RA/size72815-processed-gene-0.61-mRNA-1//-1//CDS//3329533150//7133//frame0
MSSELQMQSTLDEEPSPRRSYQRDVSNLSDASMQPLVAARHPVSPQPASPYSSNTECELSSYREDPMMNEVILSLVSGNSEEEVSEEFGVGRARARKLASVKQQDTCKRPPASHMSSTDNTNKDKELKQKAKAIHKTCLKTMTSNVPKLAKLPDGEGLVSQHHEDDGEADLRDLMSSAVQSHSNAILALVERGSGRASFSSSIPPARMPLCEKQDTSTLRAEQPSRILATPIPQHAKKETKNLPPQTTTVPPDTSSVAAAAALPEFTRDRRLQPEPGAVRVCGFDGNSDDDDMDSGHFSVTDPSTYSRTEATDNSTTVIHHRPLSGGQDTASLPTSSGDLIQAVLVEDGEEQKRAAVLAEREAALRQRELELEKKLQQMTMSTVVQAEVVHSPAAPEKKKKGIFGRFKFGKGSSHKSRSETETLTKSPSRADPSQSPLPPVAPLKDLVRTISTSGLVSVDASTREDGSVSTEGSLLSHLSSIFHRSPSLSLPFLQCDEVQGGNVLSQGTFNEVRVLKTLNMRGNWNVTSHYREAFTPSETEQQINARNDLANRWLMKQSKYVVKTVRLDLRTKKRLQGEVLLRAEANLLSYLSHEHIVQSAAMDESGLAVDGISSPASSGFFVVVEQVVDTLYDRLTKTWPRKMKGPQFFAERIQFAVDMASALSYIHSMNVIYCDLKPESVGFDAKGNLKLFNFGGATVLKNATQPYDQRCETFHVYTGTHPYVAPEVALHRKSGINLDTYAFSILLWEMVTLKEPFADLMVHEYAEKVIQRGKRPKLDKKYPDSINQVIDQCWQGNPKRRPRMDEVHGVLMSEVSVLARQEGPKRTGIFK